MKRQGFLTIMGGRQRGRSQRQACSLRGILPVEIRRDLFARDVALDPGGTAKRLFVMAITSRGQRPN